LGLAGELLTVWARRLETCGRVRSLHL
jgi:hypothetical protein